MKLFRTYFAMLVTLLLLTGCQQNLHVEEATVVRAVDGDTIQVQLGQETKTVRLLLVDTPESVHPTKPVQPFGKEASSYVKSILPEGTAVGLEYGNEKTDKYGRVLAYVWLDHKMLNKLLIEKGFARVAYVYEPNTKYEAELREAEEQAKKNKLGIWSIPNYVTEKGFNETAQVPAGDATCKEPLIKGNITSSGEKIYHTPASSHYKVTKAEKMFCTEEEATAAGFRKAA